MSRTGSMHEETERATDSEAIRAWLIARIAEDMRISADQVAVDRPFPELGLSSVDAAGFSGELGEWLGRKVSPLVLWDHPTIDALARHLGEAPADPPSP